MDFTGRLDVPLDVGWSAEPWQDQSPVEALSTTFHLPADRIGPGSQLLLEGLWWSATVTINGQRLPPVTVGDVPAAVAIGAHLRPGENELQIALAGAGDTPLAVAHDGLSRRLSAAKGPWLIEPPLLQLRPEAFIERTWLVTEGTQVIPHAAVVDAPDGSQVRFFAALDGAVLQELGAATVRGGAAVGSVTDWTGPRWSLSDPGLVMLNAELLDGDGAALDAATVRTGVRALSVEGSRLMLDETPLPLLAVRVGRAERRSLSRWFQAISGSGANAVEFHGQIVRRDDLDIADALGLPVVVMGRCAGRSPDLNALPAEYLQQLDAHDDRLARFLATHPSVVLLALEEHGTPTEHGARLARASLRDWSGRPPMTGVELPAGIADFVDGGLRCGGADCGDAWITEIFDRSLGESGWPDAADALNERIHAGATGGVAPRLPNDSVEPPRVGRPLAAQVSTSGQRASSEVTVTGASPGTLIILQADHAGAAGAFADQDGAATLSLWHRGSGAVSAAQTQQTVTLTPRRWSDFQRRGSTTAVVLP